MHPMARGGGHELDDATPQRSQRDAAKDFGSLEHVPEPIHVDPIARGLDHRDKAMRIAADAEYRTESEQAFSSHCGDGDLMTGCHFADHRDDACVREVGGHDVVSRSRQRGAHGYAYSLGFREQRVTVAWREIEEDVVSKLNRGFT
jgi:hypothetical protein